MDRKFRREQYLRCTNGCVQQEGLCRKELKKLYTGTTICRTRGPLRCFVFSITMWTAPGSWNSCRKATSLRASLQAATPGGFYGEASVINGTEGIAEAETRLMGTQRAKGLKPVQDSNDGFQKLNGFSSAAVLYLSPNKRRSNLLVHQLAERAKQMTGLHNLLRTILLVVLQLLEVLWVPGRCMKSLTRRW